jgi:hypothetical protein
LDAPAADWMVYGDALQDAGDPRGELIALADKPEARDTYVVANWDRLVGPEIPGKEITIAWRYSVPERVTLRPTEDVHSGVGSLAKLLASRIAPELRGIELRGPGTTNFERAMDMLAKQLPPKCTRFWFVDERATHSEMLVSRDFDPDENLVKFGSFDPFWARAEEVAIDCADVGQLALGSLSSPALRSFALRGLRMADYEDIGDVAETLNELDFPACESFELRCAETWFANIPAERKPYVAVYSEDDRADEADDGDCEGVDWSGLGGMLHALTKAPLRRLALTSFTSAQTMLDALAGVGLAPALRELDLSDSMLGDDNVAWLIEHRALFAKLERLVLRNTPLTPRAVKTLAALGPTIVHTPGLGATYRYVVGAE